MLGVIKRCAHEKGKSNEVTDVEIYVAIAIIIRDCDLEGLGFLGLGWNVEESLGERAHTIVQIQIDATGARENEVDITITIDIERHRTVCCIHRGKSGSGLNIHKCAVPESVKSIRLIKAASNENFVSIITINVDGGSSSERMDILVPDNIEINRYRLELWVL